MNLLRIPLLAALLLTSAAVAPAQANIVTFFGEDTGLGDGNRLLVRPNAEAAETAFLANVFGVGTETFESFAAGTTVPLAIAFPGAGTATLSGTGTITNIPTGTSGAGRFPISGDQYVTTNNTLLVEFSDPVAAFGFYATDVGDFNGQITLTLADGNNTLINIGNSTNVPSAGVLYFGLISDTPFTTITFGNTAAGTDVFGFDNFTVGSLQQVQPTPEPMSLALLGVGVAGIAWSRRRIAHRA